MARDTDFRFRISAANKERLKQMAAERGVTAAELIHQELGLVDDETSQETSRGPDPSQEPGAAGLAALAGRIQKRAKGG